MLRPSKKPSIKRRRIKKYRREGKERTLVRFDRECDLPPAAISLSDMRYNKTGQWRSLRPVINYNRCTSCMVCWKYCPDSAIEIIDGKPHINLDYCKGCNICIEECPVRAITLIEEKK